MVVYFIFSLKYLVLLTDLLHVHPLSITTYENKKHPLPEMQTHTNESMKTQLMPKNHTHAKTPCLPAGGVEGREKGQ